MEDKGINLSWEEILNATYIVRYKKKTDKNGKVKDTETIDLDEFISVKGIKAMGNQFVKDKVKSINITIPEPIVEEEKETEIKEAQEMEIPEEGIIGELFSD